MAKKKSKAVVLLAIAVVLITFMAVKLQGCAKSRDHKVEDRFIGISSGGGFGTKMDQEPYYVYIYNDGYAEMIFFDTVIYKGTVDIDDLKSKIDVEELRTLEIESALDALDGGESFIYLYSEDGTEQKIGGYVITTQKYNDAWRAVYDSLGKGTVWKARDKAEKNPIIILKAMYS